MWRTLGGLAIVVGLLLLLRKGIGAWARRGGGIAGQLGPGGRAPSGVLFILGRFPAARGQTLVLLKLGRRVLLVSQTAQGFAPLAEITDPDEVALLASQCEQAAGDSPASRFGSLLRGLERDARIVEEHEPGPYEEPEVEQEPASKRGARESMARLRGMLA